MPPNASTSTDGSTDEPVEIDGGDHRDSVDAETDATIGTVDVDAHQPLTGEYVVRDVPTLVLFADGEQTDRVTGALPEDRLRDLIESHTAAWTVTR